MIFRGLKGEVGDGGLPGVKGDTGVTGSDYRPGCVYQIVLCTVSAEVNRVRVKVSVMVRVRAICLYL